MGKRRGHTCYFCGRSRPNEAFSGRGHRRHLCKECSRLPKEEREAREQQDDIFGFLTQSNISKKNIARLRVLRESSNVRTAELAEIVLQVALVKPRKKKRMSFLARKHPELLRRMEETGLTLADRL